MGIFLFLLFLYIITVISHEIYYRIIVSLVSEVIEQKWEYDTSKERDRSMLFTYAIIADSIALRRFEQYDYAKNVAEHGSRGVWLHVIYRKIDRFFVR